MVIGNLKLRVASFDIVFQEVPGEVTLALNISGCPCRCKGCHSQHLWQDTGEPLTTELLDDLIARYAGLITCVCFMGGDQNPEEVLRLAGYVQNLSTIKVAWYSGRPALPPSLEKMGVERLDYLKLGPYIETLGGLKSEATNQRFYKRVGDGTPVSPYEWQDITSYFWRKTL